VRSGEGSTLVLEGWKPWNLKRYKMGLESSGLALVVGFGRIQCILIMAYKVVL
jgi:hypothetical protein